MICPRCKKTEFTEIDCGPDSYDDDITWTAYRCKNCGLWYSDWIHKWLVDVESWQDEEEAKEYETEGGEK